MSVSSLSPLSKVYTEHGTVSLECRNAVAFNRFRFGVILALLGVFVFLVSKRVAATGRRFPSVRTLPAHSGLRSNLEYSVAESLARPGCRGIPPLPSATKIDDRASQRCTLNVRVFSTTLVVALAGTDVS